jgi:hypothetical protein
MLKYGDKVYIYIIHDCNRLSRVSMYIKYARIYRVYCYTYFIYFYSNIEQYIKNIGSMKKFWATHPRPTPGGRHNHNSLEANLGRERQSRLVWGQPRARDTSTPRTWPTSSERRSHGYTEANPRREAPEANPRAGDTITARPRLTLGGRQSWLARPTLGGRRSHASTEANPWGETQSRLVWGQPWMGDAVTARPRPTLGERRSHDSLEVNLEWEMQSCLAQGQSRAGDNHGLWGQPRVGTQSRLARGQPPWGRNIVKPRPRPSPTRRRS